MMKKMINKPEDLVNELLEGFALAFPERIKLIGDRIVTRANPKEENKVALVTLGGSGHEPGLSGFVGPGMLDASVPGEIFAAPAPDRIKPLLVTPDLFSPKAPPTTILNEMAAESIPAGRR